VTIYVSYNNGLTDQEALARALQESISIQANTTTSSSSSSSCSSSSCSSSSSSSSSTPIMQRTEQHSAIGRTAISSTGSTSSSSSQAVCSPSCSLTTSATSSTSVQPRSSISAAVFERQYEQLLRRYKAVQFELREALPSLGDEDGADERVRYEHRYYLEYADLIAAFKELVAKVSETEYLALQERLKTRVPNLQAAIREMHYHLSYDIDAAHYARGVLEITPPARPPGFEAGPEALDEIVERFGGILQRNPPHAMFSSKEALKRSFGSEFSMSEGMTPTAYLRGLVQSLAKCIRRIKDRVSYIGIPTNATAREAFYVEKENMLLHVLVKLRLLDPLSQEAVQLTITFLKILIINSGHCGIALDIAVMESYKQICLGHHATTPEERVYNELASFRQIIATSYLPPADRETVVYARELLRRMGSEFGLIDHNRIRAQDAQGIDNFLSSAPTVDVERDRIRFRGYYNPATIVHWMTDVIRQDPDLRALCIRHCTPPGTWTVEEIDEKKALAARGEALHLRNAAILCTEGESVDAALAAKSQSRDAAALRNTIAGARQEGERKEAQAVQRSLEQRHITLTNGQTIDAALTVAIPNAEERQELQLRIQAIRASVRIETNRNITRLLRQQGVSWNPSYQTTDEAINEQTRAWRSEEIALARAEVARLRRHAVSEEAIKDHLANRAIFVPSGKTVEQVIEDERKELYLHREGFVEADEKITEKAMVCMLTRLQVLTPRAGVFATGETLSNNPSEPARHTANNNTNTNLRYATSRESIRNMAIQAGNLGVIQRRVQRVLNNDPTNAFAIARIDTIRPLLNNLQGEVSRLDQALITTVLDAADALCLQGDFTAARSRLELALNIAPNNAVLCNRLGELLFKCKDFAAAKKRFNQVLTAQPNNAVALRGLGQVYLRKKKYVDAARCFERALANAPHDVESLHGLGRALYGQESYVEAQRHFEHALVYEPHNATILNLLGKTLWNQDYFPEAQTRWEQALTEAPYDVAILCDLGDVLEAQDNYVEAKKRYAQALAINPNHGLTLRSLGNIYRKESNLVLARQYLERALAIVPNNAYTLKVLGDVLRQTGDLTAAKTHLERANAIEPRDDFTLSCLGAVVLMQNHFESAKSYYEQALVIKPNDAFVLRGLGEVFRQTGDLTGAKTHLERANVIKPRDFSTLSSLAEVLRALQDFPAAQRYFEQALAVRPHDISMLNGLGNLLRRQQEFRQAVPYFQRVLAINAQNICALNGLGICFKKQNEHALAKTYFDQVLAIEPRNEVALIGLEDVQCAPNNAANAQNTQPAATTSTASASTASASSSSVVTLAPSVQHTQPATTTTTATNASNNAPCIIC